MTSFAAFAGASFFAGILLGWMVGRQDYDRKIEKSIGLINNLLEDIDGSDKA